jgi:hypothetical protein
MDNVWSILQYPISPVEEEAFAQVAHFFSATDEELRCNNSRRELQQAHMTALIEAKRVADEQRRQEQQAAEDRRQNQQELARQEQENTRLRQEADREQKRPFEKMQQEVLLMITTCMVEMRSAALTGNDAAMKEAIAKAQMYISTTPAFNNQEKQLMQQFKFIIAALPREKNNLQKIFAEFAKINAKSNVRIVLERGSASLLEFKPGELIYRGRGNEKVSLKYDAMIPRTRTSLFISMEHALKMKNCEFYSDLYHGKIPADSTVPAGFWKQIWPFAKQAL